MIKHNGEVLRKRELEKSYFVIYCLNADLYMEGEYTKGKKKRLYVFFGCTLDGRKKYMSSVFASEVERTSEWYDFYQGLKKRGMEHVIFALVPNEKELRDALKLSFPKVEMFTSCFRTIGKLRKYNTYKTNEDIYREVKRLYLAKDLKEYELNYVDYKKKYGKYQFIMDMLDEEIKGLKINYKYSSSIRRIVYAFNYVIQMEKRFSILSNQKIYKDKDEFLDDCSWFINCSESATHYHKEEWTEVINEIYEEKKELIKPYL